MAPGAMASEGHGLLAARAAGPCQRRGGLQTPACVAAASCAAASHGLCMPALCWLTPGACKLPSFFTLIAVEADLLCPAGVRGVGQRGVHAAVQVRQQPPHVPHICRHLRTAQGTGHRPPAVSHAPLL